MFNSYVSFLEGIGGFLVRNYKGLMGYLWCPHRNLWLKFPWILHDVVKSNRSCTPKFTCVYIYIYIYVYVYIYINAKIYDLYIYICIYTQGEGLRL